MENCTCRSCDASIEDFYRFEKTIFQYYNRLYFLSRPCLCKIIRILKIITQHPYPTYMTVIKYLLQCYLKRAFYGVDFFQLFGFKIYVRQYFFINHARMVCLPLYLSPTQSFTYVIYLSATQLQ